MGEFLDRVNKRQDSSVAIAHRIALNLSSSAKNALIVEGGEDVFFYSSLCQRLKPVAKPDFFVANGRAGVLGVLSVAKDLGKIDRCFGIIDRDFNFDEEEFLVDNHCFVLGVYSFENYFSSKDTLVDLGKALFALEPGTPYMTRWETVINNFLDSAPTLLIREHACAYWCKLNRIPCLLENFNPCASVVMDEAGVLSLKDQSHERFIADTKAVIPSEKQCEIDIAVATLSKLHWSQTFRGHYFWKLVVKALNGFREWLDSQFRLNKKSRTRTKSEISDRHAIESCSPFVGVPDQLMSFLSVAGS